VLIVEDDTLVGMGLRANLERLGHQVVGQAANGAEAAALFRQQRPDLMLVDVRLGIPGAAHTEDGIELARQLWQERHCPMIVVSAYSDPELLARAAAAAVFGYLVKPAGIEALAAQIEVAVRRFDEHEKLLQEKQELTETLETRKLVERAKGIIMKRLKLEEPEAHRHLQQLSQRKRVNIAEIARKVIESEELLPQ
jgi:response regulator NasT